MVARPTELIADLCSISTIATIPREKVSPLLDYIVSLERELAGEKAEVDNLSTELYRKIDTISASNALLNKTITRLIHRLEMINGVVKTLASTVEALSDSD